MSFAQLKKASGNFADLSQKLKAASSGGQGGNDKDDRYWGLTVDSAGNGYAVIRFLPAPEGEETPVVTLYSHGFKGPTNKWYIENSRTTIGEPDPVSEANSELWNTGLKENQEIVRERKRRKHFISNILVVKDPAKPENEGKVMLYKYGAKIMGKLELALNPEFPDDPAFDPFDMWGGADFKLKARKVDGQRNYDSSGFDKCTPIFDGDDAALEKLWKAEYSLQAEVAPDKFKSYDELKRRFEQVIGKVAPTSAVRQTETAMEGATRTPTSEPVAATRSVPDETATAPFATEAEAAEARYAHLLAD